MIVTNAYKHAKSVPKCKDTLFTAFCAIFVASYLSSTAGHTVSAPAATGYYGPFRTLNGERLPFQLKSNCFGDFFQFIICLSATLQMDLQINPFVMST
jgi:hypothetical protein